MQDVLGLRQAPSARRDAVPVFNSKEAREMLLRRRSSRAGGTNSPRKKDEAADVLHCSGTPGASSPDQETSADAQATPTAW